MNDRYRIPTETIPGMVSLNVKYLDRAVVFYTRYLGLKLIHRQEFTAHLGVDNTELVILEGNPEASYLQSRPGLYHMAFLLPSRLDLALAIKHLDEMRWPIEGLADHNVSESVYLCDPDGNGIELYRDFSRSEWPYTDGQLKMDTQALDLNTVMAELSQAPAWRRGWEGLPPQTVLGHLHLRVSDVAAAEAFYCNILGFELIMHYAQSAAFVSAGGYHHHIGLNAWETAGAPPAPAEAVGLRYFSLRLPSQSERDRIVSHVTGRGIPVEQTTQGPMLRDPSQNGILLTVI